MTKLILYFFILSLSLSSFAQRANSIEENDLYKAVCRVSSDKVEFANIKSFLRAKGHNVTKLLRDPNFKSYHIREIYDAVMLMPKWLRVSNIRLKSQIIYKSNPKLDGVAMFGNSIITINPKEWFKYSSDRRVAIIFHELAHALSDAIAKLDTSLIWRNVDGGWYKNERNRLEPVDFKTHTSEYSSSHYFEDFAESVAAYRIDPTYLKKISLKKYTFIKDTVFLGQEFLTESDCDFNINDSIDFSEIEKTLKSELNKDKLYKITYEGLLKRRRFKLHPKAIERLFYRRAIKLYILRVGDKFNSTKEEYILKNTYRAFYLNTKSFKNIMSSKSKVYIEKLKRNPNITRKI